MCFLLCRNYLSSAPVPIYSGDPDRPILILLPVNNLYQQIKIYKFRPSGKFKWAKLKIYHKVQVIGKIIIQF